MKRIDYINGLDQIFFFYSNLKTIDLEELEKIITEMQDAIEYVENFDISIVKETMNRIETIMHTDNVLKVEILNDELIVEFPKFIAEYIKTSKKQPDVWKEWDTYGLKKKMKLLKQALSDRIELAKKRIDFLNEEI